MLIRQNLFDISKSRIRISQFKKNVYFLESYYQKRLNGMNLVEVEFHPHGIAPIFKKNVLFAIFLFLSDIFPW